MTLIFFMITLHLNAAVGGFGKFLIVGDDQQGLSQRLNAEAMRVALFELFPCSIVSFT
jgi:hypothetical protein